MRSKTRGLPLTPALPQSGRETCLAGGEISRFAASLIQWGEGGAGSFFVRCRSGEAPVFVRCRSGKAPRDTLCRRERVAAARRLAENESSPSSQRGGGVRGQGF